MTDPRSARIPATPLVVHDPFMSVWSHTDELTQSWPIHWTGKNQSMAGMAFIDGKSYRFMGLVTRTGIEVPAMRQTGREVTPLRTLYRFQADGVELTLTFTTPTFPKDLELMARPVSYIDIEVASLDGKSHTVSAYIDWSTNWATGNPETDVIWGRHRAGQVEALFVGAREQMPLHQSGDEVQIDWGYLYTSAEPGTPAVSAFGDARTLRDSFAATGSIPARDDVRDVKPLAMPEHGHRGLAIKEDGIHQERPAYNVAAWSRSFGAVDVDLQAFRLLVAFDQVYGLEYFHRRLRPFWRRNGQSAIGLVELAWNERQALCARAIAYDDDLIAQLIRSGGDTYARIGILAFRQCLGGHVLVADLDGKLLYFSKENSSNGCLGTVDLTYPSAPFFLHYNPALLEAQMRPICAYASGGRWPFPYAPHDVGQFPLANGQVYGGGELTGHNQMPYEECGNMLILAAALLGRTGETRFIEEFWPLWEKWATYLIESGVDPENQLCTDDFAGHLSHNANLSLKAIVGIGAYSLLCDRLGKIEEAGKCRALARDWADEWVKLADDGDAFRLAFDAAGSWSQKYNLIWDRILGLNLFPAEIAAKEMSSYKRNQDHYGLPLDSREHYTKLDWLVWTACLTDNRADFDAILAPVANWLDDAPERVPLSDWFHTQTGLQIGVGGFRSRPVVGGIYIKLMLDRSM
ncbi:DUF4965 domain-containing protein [Rhizobium sp. S152]|uniref:glutaminase domain-containing protein n=1 Tax=Rhizobium sp. S152 TaxID=3055038 RepID=UPI0025A9D0A1|nr:DUF4965 domain-containing protein [Rhizobium sp. S152]MDM9629042.1 DUF4965 domain-containing protein [Rhizobium sp. S152]